MSYTPGPFLNAHWYLQWGGKLPGGEEWSCGLRLAPANAGTLTIDSTLMNAAAAAVQAYHQNASTGISPRALLSFVKLNRVGTDGRYTEQITNEKVLSDIAGGGIVGNTPPNQVCLVVSLTTGVSRGPAHRGRFYLPLPTYAIDDQGQFAAANAQAVSGTTDTFIAALNGLSPNAVVSVLSRKAGAPAIRSVTGNEVGRVYDTQRRRRRKLNELYQ